MATFWDSLSPDQKRVFRSLAYRRIFAAGARLMEEGEQADHVAVILSGLTEIRVQEDGMERVVARRGPGELVGERAALHVSVRSATVVAIQSVEALVMPTERFVAFVSDHPGVLALMEHQIFRRLREGPIGSEGGEPRTARDLPASQGEGDPRQQRSPLRGQNCTVVHTDVAAFSAGIRNDKDRERIRQALWDMTRRALHPIWHECRCEDRGDGHLIIAYPDVPTEQVIERLLDVLPGELRRHNRTYGEPVRIQLRVAVDVGPVTEDEMGVSGMPIIRATRMLEGAAFRDAITGTRSVMGIIVSPFVHDNAIQNGRGSLDPANYATVPVQVKETDMTAWMQLIDGARQ
jgi:hypothetical protein